MVPMVPLSIGGRAPRRTCEPNIRTRSGEYAQLYTRHRQTGLDPELLTLSQPLPPLLPSPPPPLKSP